MSNIYNFSIEFRGNNKQVTKVGTILKEFAEIVEHTNPTGVDDKRKFYKILMGTGTDLSTHKRITDEKLHAIVPRLYSVSDTLGSDIEVELDKDGLYRVGMSSSSNWATPVTVFEWMSIKYGIDFEMYYSTEDGELAAGEFVYINKVLNETHVELEAYDEEGDEAYDGGGEYYDKDGNLIEDLYDEFEKEIAKYSNYTTFDFTYTPPVVLIDCENNYLDNLKSFVDSNKGILKLDEHLVKSGLFKTTIGTEKRRRIEVEISGVKLYADSKPAVKQRKSNVEKLKKLLS